MGNVATDSWLLESRLREGMRLSTSEQALTTDDVRAFALLEQLAEDLLISAYRLPVGARRSEVLAEAALIHEKAVSLRALAASLSALRLVSAAGH